MEISKNTYGKYENENSNNESVEELSPLASAQNKLEKRLLGLDELLEIFALQASMIGSWNNSYEPTRVIATDGLNLKDEDDIKRFYKIDSLRADTIREFSFEGFGKKSAIIYRSYTEFDENWNEKDIYPRFSEYFEVELDGEKFVFEKAEDTINFLHNIHRALHFQKHNKPVLFKQTWGDDLQIQSVYLKNENLAVKKGGYYWQPPKSTDGIAIIIEDGKIMYWEDDSETTTKLTPSFNAEGEMSLKTTIKTVHFKQPYIIDRIMNQNIKLDARDNDGMYINRIIKVLNKNSGVGDGLQ